MTNAEIAAASKIMLGTTEAVAMYIGSTQIWKKIAYDAELQYLEGTGTQYINTGIINNSNVIVDMKMSASGTNCLHGSEYTYQYRFKWGADGNGCVYYGYQNNHTSSVTFQLDQPCTYYLKQGEQYVKDYQGNTILSSSETLSTYSTNPIMLFKCYSGSDWVNTSGTIRIYSCKIYNNGILMDLIPVRKGQIGYLYDKVSGQLYGNNGTGSFTLGPDKPLPPGYTQLEYISSTSTGGQYINMNILLYDVLNKQYDIATKFSIVGNGKNTSQQGTLFGCQKNVNPWPGTFIRYKDDNNITGRYIGANIKDNNLGAANTIIELAEKTPPEKNVYNYNNNNSTHTWGTSLFSILDANGNPDRFVEATLYYFKLFVNGTLVRDMVPCKNPDDVVGLYDVVNNVFYTSPNGALFVAGPTI